MEAPSADHNEEVEITKDPITFRPPAPHELSQIVALLADDPLGSRRESFDHPLPTCYLDAFEAIERDPNHQLIVAVMGTQVIGVMQLSFLPSLTHRGSWRAQIEGVRVASKQRSIGVGKALLEHAVQMARSQGCRIVQLTTDQARPNALRFYERHGFTHSHHGLKMKLD